MSAAPISAPLLVHGDKELSQIAAALQIPEDSQIVDNFSPPWKLCLPYVCVASIGAFLFGYHSGVLNATLEFIAEDLGLVDNSFSKGWIVSICLVGSLIGSIFSGTVADELGRRRTAELSSIPIILGSFLSALSKSLAIMLMGRFLVGFGLGVGAPAAALYVTEISPAVYRGTFGALCQIAACFGLLGALVAGLPVATIPGWWRICFWISVIPAVLLALGLEFSPESPRWLFKRCRWYEAEIAIKRLWGVSNVKVAAVELVRGEADSKTEQGSYEELLSRRYAKLVGTGAAILAFQQFSGINAVFYFSSTLFRNAGITSNLVASVCVGIVNLIASCLAAVLMDRLGRKTLLIASFFGMSLGMLIQVFAMVVPNALYGQSYTLLCGTLFYVFMFAVGVGPVPMALLPELFPNRIRAKAMAFSMSILWVTNASIGLMYLPIVDKLGSAFLYKCFAVVSFCGALFVKKYVVETNGRSLEDIEASLFGDF